MSDELFDSESTKKRLDAFRKRIRERNRSDLKKVVQMPEGRRLLWRIMGEAKIGRVPYANRREDTDFNCGKLAIGLYIRNRIPSDLYAVMEKEAENDKLNQEFERQQEETDDAD